MLADFLKTSDRAAAIALGQSLEYQSFLLDVTRNHRLRDSPSEIYELGDTAKLPVGVLPLAIKCYSFSCPKICHTTDSDHDTLSSPLEASFTSKTHSPASNSEPPEFVPVGSSDSDASSPVRLPSTLNGSPTAWNSSVLYMCYSPICSRCRASNPVENLPCSKPAESGINNLRVLPMESKRRETTWTQSVPFSVFESLSTSEIKRQETIFEFMQGEHNYVQDMQAVKDLILSPIDVDGALSLDFPGGADFIEVNPELF